MDTGKEKVRCPYCGHPVNANRSADAVCKGVFFKCKNKECRKVFELRYNGFKYREIAELLELSTTTVGKIVEKLKKSLQQELKKEW